MGGRRPRGGGGRAAGVRAAAAVGRDVRTDSDSRAAALRITGGTNRRLRVFAVTQIAASFVLLAGASMLLEDAARAAGGADRIRHAARAGDQRAGHVLRKDAGSDRRRSTRKPSAASRNCPAWTRVAVGTLVPWRDAAISVPASSSRAKATSAAPGEEDPRARFRDVSPGFFAALGVPIIAGRDFNDADRRDAEPVVIVSQSLAQRMFPNQDAVNRHLMWTDPVMKFIDISTGAAPHRRSRGRHRRRERRAGQGDDGVSPVLTQQFGWAARLFVHAQRESVRAGGADHQHHPQHFGRSAGGARRHAGRRARRSAGAGPAEHAGVRRVRGGGAGDRGGRCRRRAGVFGERADARIRHPAGHRIAAAAPADGRDRGGRGHGGIGVVAGAVGGYGPGDVWRQATFQECGCRMRCR